MPDFIIGLLLFIISIFLGIVIGIKIKERQIKKSVFLGNLVICDSDDPNERPYVFVEFGKDIPEITSHKTGIFKIDLIDVDKIKSRKKH